jgi:hypothetical protein
MPSSTPRVAAPAALVALVLLGTASAGGDPANPEEARGRAFFEQAVEFVNDGKTGIHQVTDFYADLHDVQIQTGTSSHSGYMRLWFLEPERFRWELRPTADLEDRVQTKILDGDKMWIIENGTLKRMHGTSGGAAAIEQLQTDRKRMRDLARFLTLDGLKGPGVVFRYEGVVEGTGVFAGRRLRVSRSIPGGGNMVFYLAFEQAADGTMRALQPEIVKMDGDPARGEPFAEFYLLKEWRRGPQFRYPGRVEALRQADARAQPERFLLAFPQDIRINTSLDPALFAPPR